MMSSFLFSEVWIKQNTAITQNVDYNDIKPFILVAQETTIRDRIGFKLYDRLMEGIRLENLNNDELDLVKLCRPVAAYQTVYMALPFLQTKIRRAGVVKNGDSLIQTVSREEMETLRSEFLQMKGYYFKRLDEWLCINSKKFPQYADPDALNKKNYGQNWDFGGFMTFKGTGDRTLIEKIINYKK